MAFLKKCFKNILYSLEGVEIPSNGQGGGVATPWNPQGVARGGRATLLKLPLVKQVFNNYGKNCDLLYLSRDYMICIIKQSLWNLSMCCTMYTTIHPCPTPHCTVQVVSRYYRSMCTYIPICVWSMCFNYTYCPLRIVYNRFFTALYTHYRIINTVLQVLTPTYGFRHSKVIPYSRYHATREHNSILSKTVWIKYAKV